MKKIIFILLIININILLLSASLNNKIEKKEKELKKIEDQINKSKRKRSYLNKKEGKILDYLDSLRKRIYNVNHKKKIYQKRLNSINQDIKKLNSEIKELNKELGNLKKVLKEVVKNSFINQQRKSLKDYMPNLSIKGRRNIVLWKYFGEYNFLLLKQTETVFQKLNKKIEIKKQKKENYKLTYLDLKISEKKLTHLKKVRNNSLNEIQNKKKYYKNLISELKTRKKELNGLLTELEKKSKEYYSSVDFKSLKGELIWPAEGKIYKKYGKIVNKKYKTQIFNDGIDIKTAYQQNVNAVAKGRVVFARRFKSFGKMVMLDHGKSFYTIYSNLNSIKVDKGDVLNPGENIGNVGKDVISGIPLLHFEIRHKQKSKSPLSWLR